jgi:hypothetical protein
LSQLVKLLAESSYKFSMPYSTSPPVLQLWQPRHDMQRIALRGYEKCNPSLRVQFLKENARNKRWIRRTIDRNPLGRRLLSTYQLGSKPFVIGPYFLCHERTSLAEKSFEIGNVAICKSLRYCIHLQVLSQFSKTGYAAKFWFRRLALF